jgi:hypothetical protein
MKLEQLRAAAKALGMELSEDDLRAIRDRITQVRSVLARNRDGSNWGPESPYRFDATDQARRGGE